MFDQWRQYITTEFTKVVVLPRDLHNRGNLHNRGTSHYRGDKLPCTMTSLKDVWLCLIRCIKVKCIMLSCVMLTKLCVSSPLPRTPVRKIFNTWKKKFPIHFIIRVTVPVLQAIYHSPTIRKQDCTSKALVKKVPNNAPESSDLCTA